MWLHEVRKSLSLDAFLYERKGMKQSLDTLLEDYENIDFYVSKEGNLLEYDGEVFASRIDALSDEGKEEFLNGFCAGAPEEYDFDSDYNTPNPWCAPWTCWAPKDYITYGLTPYDMGVNFANKVGEEYVREVKEEKSYWNMVKNMRL